MSDSIQDENLPEAPEWTPQRFSLGRLRQRRGFWLMCACPPMIVIVAMTALTVGESTRVEQHQDQYLKALDGAYARGDFAATNRFFTKLAQYNYKQNPNARFIGAVLDTRAGRKEAAARNLAAVAPSEGVGFRPAHLWKAKTLLQNNPTPTQSELHEIRHHLESALGTEEDKEEPWIRSTLGKACVALKDYAAALDHLGRVADQQPGHYVYIARIHAELGNTDSQLAALEKATEAALARLRQQPDSVEIRVAVAQLYHDQGDLRNAVAVAVEGLESTPNDRRLRACLSKLMVSQFDQLRRSAEPDQGGLAQELSALQKALEMDATNQLAISRLQSLMEGSDDDRNAAHESLKKMLARGQSTGTVHFILGTHAVRENDIDVARFHFQQAYDNLRNLDEAPQVPSLLNNLAWLMMQDNKDPDQALKLVEQGITLLQKSDPRIAFMRETRGQLYIRLEEWDKAIADLEFALPQLQSGKREAHLALAQAYTRLGEPDIAAEHQRLAEAESE